MDTEGSPDVYDSLDGQVALVTGATRGIGAAIAAELAALDATVYAGARDTDDVTADDQRSVRLDVTEADAVAAAIDRIEAETGRLDVLVNNAGVFERTGSLAALSMDAFDRTMAVNLRGPVLVTKHALALLLDGEGARVVNVSSDLGQFTGGQMSGSYPAYRLSKVGLGGLTAYLHGGDRGIWRDIRDALAAIDAPTTAEELGIDDDVVIEALTTCHEIRDRYTILGNGMKEAAARDVARKTGVI